MSPELEKECEYLINKFVLEENIKDFYLSPSMRFLSEKQKINLDYFKKCLGCISNLSWGFNTNPGSFYNELSEYFIEYFSDHLDWKWVSSSSKLSEEFVEKNLDKVNWHNMMNRQFFSEDFMTRHVDKLGDYQIWVNYLYNYKCRPSKNFLLKHKDRIRKDLWEHDLIQKLL
jgi:hypothetical protein